jgi:TnpA family transposase
LNVEQENTTSDLENDPKYLLKLLNLHSLQLASATARKDRLEDLLKRSSSKKLNEKKREQMIKRLNTAKTEKEQSLVLIEQIKSQVEKLGIKLEL